MQYRNLGKSPLKVSALCLGTMMFGDQTDRAEAARIVAHAHEHGVNFIDTADVYTTGASGDDGRRRCSKAHAHDWVLATKVGNTMSRAAERSALLAQPGCCATATPACSAWAPTTSTSTTCTATSTAWTWKSRCARIDDAAARRQDPLLGRVELPRLAHRRGGAPGARAEHARRRWSASRTTTCSTACPRSRCCRPARTTASASCPTARSRAACWPASTRPAARRPNGTRAGARRQAHAARPSSARSRWRSRRR